MAEMLLRVFANNITRSQVLMHARGQSCLQANRTPSTPTHTHTAHCMVQLISSHMHTGTYIFGKKKLKTLPCLHVLHCILIRQRKEVVMNCEHAVSFHLWTPHRLVPPLPRSSTDSLHYSVRTCCSQLTLIPFTVIFNVKIPL